MTSEYKTRNQAKQISCQRWWLCCNIDKVMCYYEDFSLDILKKLLLLCLDFLEVLPVANTVRRESVRTCFQFQPVRLILQFMVRSFLFFFFGGGGDFWRDSTWRCTLSLWRARLLCVFLIFVSLQVGVGIIYVLDLRCVLIGCLWMDVVFSNWHVRTGNLFKRDLPSLFFTRRDFMWMFCFLVNLFAYLCCEAPCCSCATCCCNGWLPSGVADSL